MGIVHHSNHARYLERGRVELLRQVGSDYLALTKQGFHFPVTELHIEYRRSINFDDIIAIETSVVSVTKARLTFGYRVLRVTEFHADSLHSDPLDAELLCTGASFHCCVNEKGRPVKMDPGIFAKLDSLHVGSDP